MVIGRYRLKTGMGLIINNDFNFGKQISLASIDKVDTNIRAHSAASSANFMQGLATTLSWSKNFETTFWTSYRAIDATLTKDKEYIATILKQDCIAPKAKWIEKIMLISGLEDSDSAGRKMDLGLD